MLIDQTSTNTDKRHKKNNQGTFSTFEGAEYISNVAAAISGGIESPLQITLQVSFITFGDFRFLIITRFSP